MIQLIVDRSPVLDTAVIYDNVTQEILDLVIDNHYRPKQMGNIYFGRIANIVEHMNGAFIDIGLSQQAFMPKRDLLRALRLKDTQRPIKEQIGSKQYVLGQISKEAYQGKAPRLESNLSLTGLTLVYLPFSRGVKVSKKVKEKNKLRPYISELESQIEDGGFIIRSNIENQLPSVDQLLEDAKELVNMYSKMSDYASLNTRPTCLYEANSLMAQIFDSPYYQKVEQATVTCKEDLNQLKAIGLAKDKIKIDDSGIALYRQNGVKLEQLLTQNQFETTKGANIVLDELEALTVVDVNAGSYQSGEARDKAIFNINVEACVKLSQVAALRQISGNILVDCIGMPKDEEKRFIDLMVQSVLTQDRAFTVLGFTRLGLLELTRKRTTASLVELLSFNLSQSDLSYWWLNEIVSELNRLSLHTNTQTITLEVNEPMYVFLMNHKALITHKIQVSIVKNTQKQSLYRFIRNH